MTEKTAVRVARFADLEFSPRFEYGEMAQVVEVCGSKDGTELGTGWGHLTNAHIPWTIKYDEVLLVLEGTVTVRTGGRDLKAVPQDCIWLPAGTELEYISPSALVFYAIHPSNWAEGAS